MKVGKRNKHITICILEIRAVTFESNFENSFESGREKFIFECHDLFEIKMYGLLA